MNKILLPLAGLIFALSIAGTAWAERRSNVHASTPIKKVSILDGAAPGSNANIITDTAALNPTFDGTTYIIRGTFATGTVVNFIEAAQATSHTITHGLNKSAAVGASDVYMLSFGPVEKGYNYNVQVENDGRISRLVIYEVVGEGH